MLRFFKEQCLGVEFTSSALRIGLLSGNGASIGLNARTQLLAPGMVTESFSAQPIRDNAGLADLFRTGLQDLGARSLRRAGISLPDSVFRIQTLEFDELPKQQRDRDRLVRWRLEKGAALDTAGTVLRYQVYPRSDRGSTVLACIAKQDVIGQYEDLVAGMGLEPRLVAPSSFNALNFYAPVLAGKGCSCFAFVWVTEGSSATIIMDQEVPRFYRYKESKAAGSAGDAISRLMRELDDSLHFFSHMDRLQQAEVGCLSIAGEPSVADPLADGMKRELSIAVDVLMPSAVHASGTGLSPSLAAAFGAGGALP